MVDIDEERLIEIPDSVRIPRPRYETWAARIARLRQTQIRYSQAQLRRHYGWGRHDDNTTSPSSSMAFKWSRFIALSVVLIQLIGPLWALNSLTSELEQLAVISLLIFSFVCLLAFGMRARLSETLVAAATYASVLMVFVQLRQGKNQSVS